MAAKRKSTSKVAKALEAKLSVKLPPNPKAYEMNPLPHVAEALSEMNLDIASKIIGHLIIYDKKCNAARKTMIRNIKNLVK
jgi:hypothetical protein